MILRKVLGNILSTPMLGWLKRAVQRLLRRVERSSYRFVPLHPGTILLIAAQDKNAIQVRLPRPPRFQRYKVRLDTGTELLLPRSRAEFRWSLHGRHFNDSNVALVYTVDKTGTIAQEVGEVEVLRQPEDDLERRYDYIRKHGGLLLGRNTFELKPVSINRWPLVDKRSAVLTHLTKNERRKLRTIFPSITQAEIPDYETEYQLIEGLAEALRLLYSRLHPSGPSNLLEGVRRPTKILSLITTQKATLQCGRTRDLFIDLVISARTLAVDHIRKIGTFRYEPLPIMAVNSHALLEVSIDQENWFIFDPFTRMYFTDDAGKLLSSFDVKTMRESDRIPHIQPHVISTSAEPFNMSFLIDADRHNYNYWCHFNYLRITNLSLPD